MADIENWVKEIQIHIIAGCSDGRDISAAFNTAKDKVIETNKSNGVLIDMPRISVPGVFATHEVISEIKGIIFGMEKKYFGYRQAGTQVEYFVHMMAHGNAVLKAGHTHEQFSYHDIEIKPASFNCGMMNAQPLALEFEGLLLSEKPTLVYGRRHAPLKFHIKSEAYIERFMQQVHGVDGTIAGNWIKSIVNLATHPYEQKKLLRDALDRDSAIRQHGIHITAGVQNYATNNYFRVDGNTHLLTILDDIYTMVANMSHNEEHEKRTGKQAPKIILFHNGSIINARARAIEAYSGGQTGYNGGDVFAIGGSNASDPTRDFGPYKTIGFYYALHPDHLNLADNLVVCGKTKEETRMMAARLRNSPLVNFMVRQFGAKITELPLADIVDRRQSFPHARPSVVPAATTPVAQATVAVRAGQK